MTLFLLILCLSLNIPDLPPVSAALAALPALNSDEIIGVALAALALDFLERRRGRRRMVDEVLKHLPPDWQKRGDATAEKPKHPDNGPAS